MCPDIAMCQNDDCPLREKCYRFCAEPDDIAQWYNEWAVGIDGQCDGFLPLPAQKRSRHPRDMDPGETQEVRYWNKDKAPDTGWEDASSLSGTHHGRYAKIVRKVT